MYIKKQIKILFISASFFMQINCHELVVEGIDPTLGGGQQSLITRKNILQIEKRFKYTRFGDTGHLAILQYNIGYGLTRTLGVQTIIPILLGGKVDKYHHKGIFDVPVFLEWNFYTAPNTVASIAAGLTIPAGTNRKIPPTGTKSVNPYFAFVTAFNSEDWYALLDIDVVINTKKEKNNIKIGSGAEINFGLGRFFAIKSLQYTKLLVSFLLHGFLEKPTKINGISDPNTGRHTIFFGPFVSFISKNNFLFDFQFEVPIARVVRGKGPKADFRCEFGVEVRF